MYAWVPNWGLSVLLLNGEGKTMNNSITKHINILGGGISGLSAAIALSKHQSTKIKVYEKSLHTGGRFKRDFQCLRNFGSVSVDPLDEFRNFGIRIRPYREIKRIIRYSKSHHFEVVSKKKPIYYAVLRGKEKMSIDNQLEQTAISRGVQIYYDTAIDVENATIIATGPTQIDSVAYGEIYEDTNIDDAGMVFLNTDHSPNGYLYVLPGGKKGEAEIINMEMGPTSSMKKTKILYQQALEKNTILSDLIDGATKKSTQGGIGSSHLLDKPFENGKYYVGEAAGLQDIGAGFGIRYAIISGYLAADSLLTGKDYNKQFFKTFTHQLAFERKRSINVRKLTNRKIDRIFANIIKKFGHELSIEEYESLRGEI